MKHKRILFLCVANSARSQMAEGLARKMFPDRTIRSAGSAPTRVNPFAIEAMAEIGIDISSHKSESVSDVDPESVDLVITLCADEVCPAFLGDAPQIHWKFDDPDRKHEELTDAERLSHFKTTRDLIQNRLKLLSVDTTGIAPIFVSSDVDSAIERYEKMGFIVDPFIENGSAIYAFVCLGPVEFHIARVSEVYPLTTTSAAYVYVTDVKPWYDAWKSEGVDGRLHAPEKTPYGLLEMAYVDPDGNLLRIGSPIG